MVQKEGWVFEWFRMVERYWIMSRDRFLEGFWKMVEGYIKQQVTWQS